MKNWFIKLLIVFLSFPGLAFAQTLEGIVYGIDEQKKAMPDGRQEAPLSFANVHWLGTNEGAVTDIDGNFTLNRNPKTQIKLVVSFTGYVSDTLSISNETFLTVKLKSSVELSQVTIEGKQQSTFLSRIDPILTEKITGAELQKAACCNLSESFTTNASVDVVYTDALSGAKKIQLLGLDGIYTQIQGEMIPMIRGLSSAYGLGFVPGTWIESIQVSKGTGSVVNGYEQMAGQINLEFLKPDAEKADKLFVNVYGSSGGRGEVNIHTGTKFNQKLSTMLFLHGNTVLRQNDNNHDGFMDTPRQQQYNFFNRWKYHSGKRIEMQLNIKGVYENKTGGQTDEAFEEHSGHSAMEKYLIKVLTKQLEVSNKTGLMFPGNLDRSLGLITSVRYHEMNSLFGLKRYSGTEKTLYANLIYQDKVVNGDNKIRAGVSFLLDDFVETYNDSLFTRREIVPGAFAEYSYNNMSTFSFVAGVRGDYHNLYGFMFNPRVNIKINIAEETIFRVAAGRGFRVANPFAENASVLASARTVIVKEKLMPEIAWNYGVSLSQSFRLFGRDASISADYFYTNFLNQVVVDLDYSAREVSFYNLDGKSYSNSFQVEAAIEPLKQFSVKTAYKYYDVRSTYAGTLMRKPMTTAGRMLLNFGYFTRFEKWKFDLTLQRFGRSRLPGTTENPAKYQRANYSAPYFTINAQVTKKFKRFEVYLGGENLTNFMQRGAIVAAADPFGPYFDASMVWGPGMGAVVYAGLRFAIK